MHNVWEKAIRGQDFTQAGELREKEIALRDKIKNLLQNIRQKTTQDTKTDFIGTGTTVPQVPQYLGTHTKKKE